MFKSGITRNPSASTGKELDYAMNLMTSEGELKLVPQMESVDIVVQPGDRLLCVHHVEAGNDQRKYYIFSNGTKLIACACDSVRTVIAVFQSDIQRAVAMSNVLVVTTSSGVGYVIWKDGYYRFIGTSLPTLDLQFQLRNQYVQTFDKGEDTGITLDTAASSHAADFSTIVPPTPQTVDFIGEHEIFIDVRLDANTSYQLQMRRTIGKVKVGMALWMCDDHDNERYAGYGNGKSPTITFATNATDTIVRLRCVVYGNADMRYAFVAVLLKGETSESGLLFTNTEENFNAVMAVANKFINQYGRKENKFIYPFFVRYALRLYDGSYVCPSTPCLMVPNSGCVPYIWTLGNRNGSLCDTFTSANIAELRYHLQARRGLEQWRDLVTGVAIAVSSPIYSFNQGAEWSSRTNRITVETVRRGESDEEPSDMGFGCFDDGDGGFSSRFLFRKYNRVGDDVTLYEIKLPQMDADKMMEDIQGNGLFYIIKEIDIDDLPSDDGWHSVDMDDDTLESLKCRCRIDDNVMSLSCRWGSQMMIYNGRLVVGNVSEQLFRGYMPSMMNGEAGNIRDGVEADVPIQWMKALVRYSQDGTCHTLCVCDNAVRNDAPLLWFAYPGLNAQSAVVWRRRIDGTYQRAVLNLQRHSLLNMAYWFNRFHEPQWSEPIREADLTDSYRAELATSDSDVVCTVHNKLQQSLVNNPFLFAPELTTRVGDADIRAMAVTTQALSQGQFGDFPLYVFTGDGIWAMTIGADGAFSSKQPVSRDVCAGSRSVVMTDRAVVFTTAHGIKVLTGATVRNISKQMDGWVPDVSMLRTVAPLFDSLIVDEPQGFYKKMETAMTAFDYQNSQLHFYPLDSDFHYVYGIDDGSFTLSDISTPLAVVNDYPDTLIQTAEGICRFAPDSSEQPRRAVALTRPFCFDDPVATKRLHDIRVVWHRHCPDSSVCIVVFVSNDRFTWWRMPSLNSHSYRWFRIALFANITPLERIESIVNH